MKQQPDHRGRVYGSPWQGVHCTDIESARHYGRHWHATYGFGLLEHGAQTSASGRGQVDAYAGDLITTNPGEVHDGRPLGGPSRRWRMVYLEPAVLASMAGTAAIADVELVRPVIQDPGLGRALRQLFSHLQAWRGERRPTAGEVLACEESLVRTCALLLERHATNATPVRDAPCDLSRVRDRIADDLLDPPTLSDLATMTGLSRYQLLRRFERCYGLPPHAWLQQQRVERARGLIRDGATLAHAAACSGFADQSHMTRRFVRQLGFTPGAWQRAAARRGLQ